jgi:predicted dehydrogenase
MRALRALPRLGFAGVGWIGLNRMKAVAASELAEIAAVFDPSLTAARAAQQVARGSEVLPSFDDLLACELDGVVIASPSGLHATQALLALQRKLAVFCQKPLGRTGEETKQVIEASRAANRLVGVDFSYRFCAAMKRIRDLVLAGELGEIYAVELAFHNAYGPDQSWCSDPTMSGGGCVMDLGIHLVDLALWTLDFPRVQAVSSHLMAAGKQISGQRQQVEDYASATLALESGAAMRLACSWRLSAGCGADIQVSFYGTRGGAAFRNVHGSFYDFVGLRFKGDKTEVLQSPPDDWPGRAAVDWARRLANGSGFEPESERAVQVAAVLDQIYDRAGSLGPLLS